MLVFVTMWCNHLSLQVSQKTLVMAVTLVQVLPPTLGEMGLILVPCFVAHPTQVFLLPLLH